MRVITTVSKGRIDEERARDIAESVWIGILARSRGQVPSMHIAQCLYEELMEVDREAAARFAFDYQNSAGEPDFSVPSGETEEERQTSLFE